MAVQVGGLEGFEVRLGSGGLGPLQTLGVLLLVFAVGFGIGSWTRTGGLDLGSCLEACDRDGLAVFSADRCECNPPALDRR